MKKWIAGILATVIGGVATGFFSGHINYSQFSGMIKSLTCDSTWEWDADRSKCVLSVTIPERLISINLTQKIDTAEGRIDFYLNKKRMPDKSGVAQYKKSPGTVHVVIPVMQGNKMVGDTKEVIFDTTQGRVCALNGMRESTGWMEKMKVDYLLLLAECGVSDERCTASLETSGQRVQVTIKDIVAVIAKEC
jgi:hypothetical protein